MSDMLGFHDTRYFYFIIVWLIPVALMLISVFEAKRKFDKVFFMILCFIFVFFQGFNLCWILMTPELAY